MNKPSIKERSPVSKKPSINLRLLGPATIEHSTQGREQIRLRKGQVLLGYLATQNQALNRRDIANLLWPDLPDKEARDRLRKTLSRLSKKLPNAIEATRQTLYFSPSAAIGVDIHELAQLIARQDYARLATQFKRYLGLFLEGLTLPNCPELDLWLIQERRHWQQQLLSVLETMSQHEILLANYEQAQRFTEQILRLDPTYEEAHLQMMQILAATGQRSAALAHYGECCRILEAELDVSPMAAIQQLHEQIRYDNFSPPHIVSGDSHPTASILTESASTPAFGKTIEAQQASESVVEPEPSDIGQGVYDWVEAPHVVHFFGRTEEQAQLRRWLLHEHCRLVTVTGIGGIGKTALVGKVARELSPHFDFVLWRSLLTVPPLDEILHSWTQTLSNQQLSHWPDRLDEQLRLFCEQLRGKRCLFILDNVESIMDDDARAGSMRTGYEGYAGLIQCLGEGAFSSCLIVTSREQPMVMARLQGDPAIQALRLNGLAADDAHALLLMQGLIISPDHETRLVQRYSGNPLALNLVVHTIQDLFDGDIESFLQVNVHVFGTIRDMLDEQFTRVTTLEREILFWLVIVRKALPLPALSHHLISNHAHANIIEVMHSLRRRSLIEKTTDGFTLQNVIMEYVNAQLVAEACSEVELGNLHVLHRHPLMQAQAKEYIREAQIRVILQPIIDRLCIKFGGLSRVEEQCASLLDSLRSADDNRIKPRRSYAGGNLFNLLAHLEVDLTQHDFSHLALWQADLRTRNLTGVNMAYADLMQAALIHTFNTVYTIAFSPDQRFLALGAIGGEIYLWDVASNCLYHTFKCPAKLITAVTFSHDCQVLAATTTDQQFYAWHIETEILLFKQDEHHGHTWAVAASPTENIFAYISGPMIYLCRTNDGQQIRTIQGTAIPTYAVAFSPDGRFLASGGNDFGIYVWEVSSGQLVHTQHGHTQSIQSLAFSPNGQWLVSGSRDQTIRFWALETGQVGLVLAEHTDAVNSVAFSPDGQWLVSGSTDRTVRIWHVESGRAVQVLYGHTALIRAIAFSPNGETIASTSNDQTVRLWSRTRGQPDYILKGHSPGYYRVAFSSDGQLASSSGDFGVRLWDTKRGRTRHLLDNHGSQIPALTFSPDGQTLISGSWDCTICLWNVQTGELRRSIKNITNFVWSLGLSVDGEMLAHNSAALIQMRSMQTGEVIRELRGHTDTVLTLAFAPNAKTLASGGMDATIRLWDIESGQTVWTVTEHDNSILRLAFSPNGTYLASSNEDQTVRLWDVQNSQLVRHFTGHEHAVEFIDFSPDGSLLAGAGANGVIWLWNCETGQLTHTLAAHTDKVMGVAFRADGQQLASASLDGTLRLWDCHNWECIQTLRADGPYARMNITGVTGITESQRAMLMALGAVDHLEITDSTEAAKLNLINDSGVGVQASSKD